jgi:hypothetical protein
MGIKRMEFLERTFMAKPPEKNKKIGGSLAWWERTFFCTFPFFLRVISLLPLARRGVGGNRRRPPHL